MNSCCTAPTIGTSVAQPLSYSLLETHAVSQSIDWIVGDFSGNILLPFCGLVPFFPKYFPVCRDFTVYVHRQGWDF